MVPSMITQNAGGISRYHTTSLANTDASEVVVESLRTASTLEMHRSILLLLYILTADGFQYSSKSPSILSRRRSLLSACTLYDVTNTFAVLRLSGLDRQSFLHGQCTNDIANLKDGQTREASILSPTGRLVDLITVAATPGVISVVLSANRVDHVRSLFDKVIFPLDRVAVEASVESSIFIVEGEGGLDAAVRSLDGPDPYSFNGAGVIDDVLVLNSTFLSSPGVTLVVPRARGSQVFGRISRVQGMTVAPSGAWDGRRVEDGRPMPDRDFDFDALSYNPLELALYHTVHFNKGCYLGQETISKVENRGAVRRQLWGIRFDSPARPGMKLCADEEPNTQIGVVTSVSGRVALGMLARGIKAGRSVRAVAEGGTAESAAEYLNGLVCDTPFSKRSVAEAAAPPRTPDAEARQPEAAGTSTSEDDRRRAKLAAMEEKIKALKQKKVS